MTDSSQSEIYSSAYKLSHKITYRPINVPQFIKGYVHERPSFVQTFLWVVISWIFSTCFTNVFATVVNDWLCLNDFKYKSYEELRTHVNTALKTLNWFIRNCVLLHLATIHIMYRTALVNKYWFYLHNFKTNTKYTVLLT